VAEAEKANGVIELTPQVGDFVGSGEPLFRLHGGAGAVDERKLRATVVCGGERTSSRIRYLRFEFWSILQSRHYQRRSMIRRPPCWRSISLTGFCAALESGICEPIKSSVDPGKFG
jgi:hypothetical protein